MSLCINPRCLNCHNPDNQLFCQSCGSELLLEGRYRAIRQLGGGGFGKTYEAIHSGISKVLKVLLLDDSKAVSLFQQEARLLTLLNHPGIPKAEGYFTYFPRNSQTPLHCLVMERIEGMDLHHYLEQRNHRPINQKLAVEWLTQLALILHEVHTQQFFHRDIKPSNIMLRADGQLALIDFGTAREVSQTYMAKHASGVVTSISSAGYTPPEQINYQAVRQSDFFALGRTFVYLLTGKAPTDPEIYDALNDELRWRTHAPQISPRLADFIEQMMARSPSQRPANTQVILQRLADIEQNLGATVPIGRSPQSASQQAQPSNSSGSLQPPPPVVTQLPPATVTKPHYSIKFYHVLLVTATVSLLWCFGLLFNRTIGLAAERWQLSQLVEEAQKSNIKLLNIFNFNGIIGSFLPSRYQVVVFSKEGKKAVVYIYQDELDNDPIFSSLTTKDADIKFSKLSSSLRSKSSSQFSTYSGEEKTIWFGGLAIFIISSVPGLLLLLRRN